MIPAAQISRLNALTPVEGLGTMLAKTQGVLKCLYDFAVQGGATSTILLKDEEGNPAILPKNDIITQVYVDTITTCASAGGTGTIALNANSAGDLLAAVDADTKTGIYAGIPVGTAATMVKCTADRQIALAIAIEALTAGKFNVFVHFDLSSL